MFFDEYDSLSRNEKILATSGKIHEQVQVHGAAQPRPPIATYSLPYKDVKDEPRFAFCWHESMVRTRNKSAAPDKQPIYKPTVKSHVSFDLIPFFESICWSAREIMWDLFTTLSDHVDSKSKSSKPLSFKASKSIIQRNALAKFHLSLAQ